MARGSCPQLLESARSTKDIATIREYFDTDPRVLAAHVSWQYGTPDGQVLGELVAKIAYDFEANARYWYFYVPNVTDLSACLSAIFRSPQVATCTFGSNLDGVVVESGHSGYSERLSSTTQFTKRVHLYMDFDLTVADRQSLVAQALSMDIYLSIRDREYARGRSHLEKPLAFISHDSRDKDSFVRELAHELIKNQCPVWYDEFTLKIGDSLRAAIERGLRETPKCILVLSPNFLSNGGWGRAEFDSVFTREILEQQNVILPVWLNVDVRAVYEYSPRLADKVGVQSTLGVAEVARRLANVIKTASQTTIN